MESVEFLTSVGGDGSIVTDDRNPTTGLANGGHRKRFVPALSQVVAVAGNTVTKATLAKDYAEKTGATVETGTYSAKEYALGNLIATGGSAKNWAIKTDGSVSGGEFSAKSYAVGEIVAGSSKDWAIKVDAAVSGGEFSAKEYALGNLTASGGSAKNWAIKTDGPVSGGEFSAKYHALAAEDTREQMQGYTETIIAVTNIDFGGFNVVDGELLTTYVDLEASTPSIVDGEFVITY